MRNNVNSGKIRYEEFVTICKNVNSVNISFIKNEFESDYFKIQKNDFKIEIRQGKDETIFVSYFLPNSPNKPIFVFDYNDVENICGYLFSKIDDVNQKGCDFISFLFSRNLC